MESIPICERFLAGLYVEPSTNFHLGARKNDNIRHAIFFLVMRQLNVTVAPPEVCMVFFDAAIESPPARFDFVFRSGPRTVELQLCNVSWTPCASKTTIPSVDFTASVSLCFVRVYPWSSLQRSRAATTAQSVLQTPAEFLGSLSFVPLVRGCPIKLVSAM